jgi:hypothetical protein
MTETTIGTVFSREPGGALQQPVFDVDGWVGSTVDEDGVEWWITKEEGWTSSPAIRLTLADRPESDGAFDSPSYRGVRINQPDSILTGLRELRLRAARPGDRPLRQAYRSCARPHRRDDTDPDSAKSDTASSGDTETSPGD